MRQHQQIVLKSYPLKTKPFDFLFEICAHSNSIASAYHLTPDQHKVLIQNQIPAYHDLYRELELLYNVEQVFEFANNTTELTPTKKEAQAELEQWSLDRSSRTALHHSISKLKMLICDTEGMRVDQKDDFVLFSLMIKRLEREELSGYVRRKLDDFSISIRTETNSAKLHGQLVNLLLTMGTNDVANPPAKKAEKEDPVAKKMNTTVGTQPFFPSNFYPVPPVVPIGTSVPVMVPVLPLAQGCQVAAEPLPSPLSTSPPSVSAKSPKQKRRDNQHNRSWEGGSDQSISSSGESDEDHYSRGEGDWENQSKYVSPWPEGKNYKTKGGKPDLEIQLHFAGFCLYCGRANHATYECKDYKELRESKAHIENLCSICRSGFHDICRNVYFLKRREAEILLEKEKATQLKEMESRTQKNVQSPVAEYGSNPSSTSGYTSPTQSTGTSETSDSKVGQTSDSDSDSNHKVRYEYFCGAVKNGKNMVSKKLHAKSQRPEKTAKQGRESEVEKVGSISTKIAMDSSQDTDDSLQKAKNTEKRKLRGKKKKKRHFSSISDSDSSSIGNNLLEQFRLKQKAMFELSNGKDNLPGEEKMAHAGQKRPDCPPHHKTPESNRGWGEGWFSTGKHQTWTFSPDRILKVTAILCLIIFLAVCMCTYVFETSPIHLGCVAFLILFNCLAFRNKFRFFLDLIYSRALRGDFTNYCQSEKKLNSRVKTGYNPYCRKTFDPTQFSKHRYRRELATQDKRFDPERGIIDLTTENEAPTARINFQVQVSVEDLSPTLAEIDKSCHLSIISEKYFEQYLKDKMPRLLPGNPATFYGVGNNPLRSKYPPLRLSFQLGGTLLSGCFFIAKEIMSSDVLIGADLIDKYSLSLIAYSSEGWQLRIGRDDSGLIPCLATKKENPSTCEAQQVAQHAGRVEDSSGADSGTSSYDLKAKEGKSSKKKVKQQTLEPEPSAQQRSRSRKGNHRASNMSGLLTLTGITKKLGTSTGDLLLVHS